MKTKLIASVLMLFIVQIFAQDGTPVLSFGNNGFKLINTDVLNNYSTSLATLPNGNSVVNLQYYDNISHTGLAYLSDEFNPIASFGINGYVENPIADLSNSYDVFTDASGNTYEVIQDNQLTNVGVIKRNIQGNLDATFGNNGSLLFPIDIRTDLYEGIVDQNGNIVLVGIASDNLTNVLPIAVRITPSGTLDNNFGNNGILRIKSTGYGKASTVLLDDAGNLLIGGYYRETIETHEASCIWKFTPNGTPVTSFGNNGEITFNNQQEYDLIDCSVLDPTHSFIYWGGYSYDGANYDAFIMKTDLNGNLISNFANNGSIIYNNGNGLQLIYSIKSDDEGNIYVGGISQQNDIIGFVSKLNSFGQFVQNFGNSGNASILINAHPSFPYTSVFDFELDELGDINVLCNAYTETGMQSGILKLQNTIHKTYSGNALNFNGAQRATMSYSSGSDLGAGDFTMEAIIQLESNGSAVYPTIISNRTTGKYGIRFAVWDGNKYSKGKLYVRIGAEQPIVDVNGYSVNDGQCHHVAVRRTGNSIQFFVDGSLSGTYTTAYTYNASSTKGYWIGNDFLSPDESYFKGSIRHIRVWKKAVTDYQLSKMRFANLSGFENGLVACWNLNESANQTISDQTSLNQNGFLGKNATIELLDPTWSSISCNSIAVKSTNKDQIEISTYDDESESTVNTITVSPNPTSSSFSVNSTLLSNNENLTLSVIDAKGNLVFSQTNYVGEKINLTISDGIYVVKLSNGTEVQTTMISIIK